MIVGQMTTSTFGQTSETQTVPRQLLIDDFNTFIEYLEETHPDPYSSYGGILEFKRKSQSLRNNITDETTVEQLKEIMRKFISILNDGHTIISGNGQTETVQGYLPLQLNIAADGIFISETDKNHIQYRGAFLESVNDIPIDTLLNKVRQIRSTENRYGIYWELCNLLSSKAGFALLFRDSEKIKLALKFTNREPEYVYLSYIPEPDWNKQPSTVKLNNDKNLLYKQILNNNNQSVGYFVWNGMFSRETVEEVAKNSPAYLDMNLNSMYQYTLKVPRPDDDKQAIKGIPALYPTFSELLKSMKEQKSEYLIIDLRHNGGGMTPLCRPLLYMLYGDKYLNFDCKAEYNRRLSRLQLKKWELDSIQQYNTGNKTNFLTGDFIFGYFFGSLNTTSIEEKRKDLSLISYYNGVGSEYTKDLNGKPIYEPVVIVLTSPRTFSAAYHFTYFLSQIGKTYIVGVPSRQAGNTFMETTNFELPNTKISGSISNSHQIFFPDDLEKGKVLMPDFTMNWTDFAKYDFDSNAEILFVLDLLNNGRISERK